MPVDIRSVSLTIIAGAAILGVLKLAQPVIIPFVVSGLLFYALDPAVDWLQRWKMPRVLGAALVLLIAIGGVGAGGYALSDDVMSVVNGLPQGVRKLRAELRRPSPQPTALDTMQQTAREIDQAAADATASAATQKGVMRVQIEEPPLRASNYLWYGSMGAIGIAAQAVMVAFLTYFLLVADDLFKRKLVKHVGPTLARKRVTVQILDEISTQIERFLLVQMLTSVIVGIVTATALWALGLEQYVVWGLAAGVLNTIPYFGPIVVTVGLAIVGYLQFGTIQMASMVASVALVITSLEGWLLTPTLLGRVGQAQSHRHLRQPAVLELDVGRVGHAAGGTDPDDGKGRQRPHRGAAAARRLPRRLIVSAPSCGAPSAAPSPSRLPRPGARRCGPPACRRWRASRWCSPAVPRRQPTARTSSDARAGIRPVPPA